MNKVTQYQQIVRYLKHYGTITSLEAAKQLDITKLTTRISEMRKKGIVFVAVEERTENARYNRYSLAQSDHNKWLLKEYGYAE